VDGRWLTPCADGDRFHDSQTGGTWNSLGEAVAGSLMGTRLMRLFQQKYFWSAVELFRPGAVRCPA
jgi:hypothetical protein